MIQILGGLFLLEQSGIARSTVTTLPHVLFGEGTCYPLKLPDPVFGLGWVHIPPLARHR
jgi:hypothetical protein